MSATATPRSASSAPGSAPDLGGGRREAVWGHAPAELAEVSPEAIQVSPLVPGSDVLEAVEDAALDRMVIAAPPGSVERRYVIAQALRCVKPRGELVFMAPKIKGGARLGRELAGFGCIVREGARRHYRICTTVRPEKVAGLDAAMEEGGPRIVPELGLWSQPGVFSWDHVDDGTQ